MITIKDMNERWLNEVKDYIIDSTIREYNIAYWDFLTSQVDNLEDYSSDRKDALAFNVKNMGYADYDEINKAFKKLGHNDLDAQDFSEDIYEICQFDNETIFHDIEDYLEVPFYAMGRMGGHWGVLCEDVCDKDLVDVEINEKELWKYIEKNYDLNDYDDIWDIDCEDIGRYADENCFNFVADKDFVKHLNDAWNEIKKQSDYMLTYDYAEYIAERLIEDNFLESKESARKSIKESKSDLLVDIQNLISSSGLLDSIADVEDTLEIAYMIAERLDPSDYGFKDEDALANKINFELKYNREYAKLFESKKFVRKSIKEEYDPTDDIINKGNSVGMDYETFLKFAEKQDYKFNVTDATFYFGINSNIKIEGRECSCIPSEDGILIIDNHSSIEIPRKDIDEVSGVSLNSKNVLRMDVFTKDSDALTVWWEL